MKSLYGQVRGRAASWNLIPSDSFFQHHDLGDKSGDIGSGCEEVDIEILDEVPEPSSLRLFFASRLTLALVLIFFLNGVMATFVGVYFASHASLMPIACGVAATIGVSAAQALSRGRFRQRAALAIGTSLWCLGALLLPLLESTTGPSTWLLTLLWSLGAGISLRATTFFCCRHLAGYSAWTIHVFCVSLCTGLLTALVLIIALSELTMSPACAALAVLYALSAALLLVADSPALQQPASPVQCAAFTELEDETETSILPSSIQASPLAQAALAALSPSPDPGERGDEAMEELQSQHDRLGEAIMEHEMAAMTLQVVQEGIQGRVRRLSLTPTPIPAPPSVAPTRAEEGGAAAAGSSSDPEDGCEDPQIGRVHSAVLKWQLSSTKVVLDLEKKKNRQNRVQWAHHMRNVEEETEHVRSQLEASELFLQSQVAASMAQRSLNKEELSGEMNQLRGELMRREARFLQEFERAEQLHDQLEAMSEELCDEQVQSQRDADDPHLAPAGAHSFVDAPPGLSSAGTTETTSRRRQSQQQPEAVAATKGASASKQAACTQDDSGGSSTTAQPQKQAGQGIQAGKDARR
ncbi:hypothetical protein CYMTET_29784 [Cymbomonas tetramitiformis]|uniref:Uncharacterized protein n=1 Tax=Cymbomonas tetramitiformis TaxID=36881 RepID=A0AAE0KUL0_9CHLO|nr:hypothetical protein CYMTET_29784 [Cymbomonas tetramitiformis]